VTPHLHKRRPAAGRSRGTTTGPRPSGSPTPRRWPTPWPGWSTRCGPVRGRRRGRARPPAAARAGPQAGAGAAQVVGGELGSLEAGVRRGRQAGRGHRGGRQPGPARPVRRGAGPGRHRGRGRRWAVEGAAATLAALARGQVATLLLTGLFLDDRRTAWFGPAPTDVAADRDALVGLGVPDPVEGRLVDVAVRAALGTGAEVRVLDPADETRSAEGRGPPTTPRPRPSTPPRGPRRPTALPARAVALVRPGPRPPGGSGAGAGPGGRRRPARRR
jgi:hypothetical protein